MKKTTIKKCIFAGAAAGVFSLALGFANISALNASALIYYEDLFTGAGVTRTYAAPTEGLESVDERSGLTLTATRAGASTRFADTASGAFSIEYRAFSEQTGVFDLESLRFVFTDVRTTESFAVEIGLTEDGHSWYNTYSPDVVRAVVDTGYGTGYGLDSGTGAVTIYGRKLNSSYCNLKAESVVLEFDPSTMEVRVGEGNAATRALVLDLDSRSHLTATGKTEPYSDFSEYSVELCFDRFGDKAESAGIIVYSLFGNDVQGEILSATSGPSTYVRQAGKVQAGKAYDALQNVSVYDLMEGKLSFDGTLTVTDPLGNTVATDNGVFTPQSAGTYTLAYTAKNGTGTFGKTTSYALEVVDYAENFTFTASRRFEDVTVGAGAVLTLPSAEIKGDYTDSLTDCTRTVSLAGTKLSEQSAAQETAFTFSQVGAYEIAYTAQRNRKTVYTKTYTVTVNAETPVFVGDTLQTEYAVGSMLSVPQKKATLGGTEYATTAQVVFADGRVNGYESVWLDTVGSCEVRYTAQINNATYVYSEYFTAVKKTSDLWKNVAGVEVQANTDLPDYADVYGNGVLLTSTRSGGVVQYANVVDLSDSNLQTPVLEAMFTPETAGVREFTSLQIRMIDAYDENNYVTVLMTAVGYGYHYETSLVCGANKNYELVGVQNSGNVSTSAAAATYIRSTMVGKYDGAHGCHRSVPFSVYFDAKNNAIYAAPKATSTLLSLVADLDNPNHVGAGNEWEGFTTGEVRLELTFNGSLLSRANVTVLSVVGHSMSGENFTDTVSPYIVLKDYSEADAPSALVGKAYPVFDYVLADEAEGALGAVENVSVYYYVNGEKKELSVKDDAFTPLVACEHYIEYCGRDSAGNVAVKTAKIQVKDSLPALTYTMQGELATTAFVGEMLNVPTGKALGGAGNLTVEESVLLGNETYALENGRFFFEQVGDYVYRVKVSDYLQQTLVLDYPISVQYSTTPLVSERVLPKAIEKGKAYVFPAFTAVSHTAEGAKEVPITITVNGTTLGADRKYKPTSVQPLEVVYSTGGWSKTYTLNVTDPTSEKYYLAGYFDYDEEETTILAEGLDFVFRTDASKATDGKARFAFINSLGMSGAEIEFTVMENNFQKLNIYLTDSADESVQVKLTVEKSETVGTTSVFRVNDGFARTMAGSFYSGQTTKPSSLRISGQNVYDYDGALLDYIDTTLSGKEFNGFSDEGVYVEFEFEGVTGGSSIALGKLWNNSFGDTDGDYIYPIVRVDTLAQQPKIGDIITLPRITAFDVLDKDVEVLLTVLNPKGVATEYTSGEELSSFEINVNDTYQFAATEYGLYEISVLAIDGSGNSFNYTTTFTVEAAIQPTLSINGGFNGSYKVGATITAPKATATDYAGKNLNVYVYLIDSCGRYHDLSKGDYTLTETGKYTVVYYTYDEFGNYAKREITVTVV